MNENDFTNLYKTWTTDKLLDIVDKPHDYQPLAVKAARIELDTRELTTEQLETAKTIQTARQQDKASKEQKVKDIENKVKSVGSSLLDNFNPIQKDAPTTDKYITLISLLLSGLFLFELYKEFGMLKFMFTDEGEWDFSMVLYFLPMILLPTTAFLFWFRKKPGWTLATIFFSYTAAGAIPLFLSALKRQSMGNSFDTIFPVVSPTVYVGSFLFCAGVTWILCKENIREVYGIDKGAMLITLCLGVAIVLLMMYAY